MKRKTTEDSLMEDDDDNTCADDINMEKKIEESKTPPKKRRKVRDRRKDKNPPNSTEEVLAIKTDDVERLKYLKPYAYIQRYAYMVINGDPETALEEIRRRTDKPKSRMNIITEVRMNGILRNMYNIPFKKEQVLNSEWVGEMEKLKKKYPEGAVRESIDKFLYEYSFPQIYSQWGLITRSVMKYPLSSVLEKENNERITVGKTPFPHPFDPWIKKLVPDKVDIEKVKKRDASSVEKKSQKTLVLSGDRADNLYNTLIEQGRGPNADLFSKLFFLLLVCGRRKAFLTTFTGQFKPSCLGEYYMRVTRDVKKRDIDSSIDQSYDAALLIPYKVFAEEVALLRKMLLLEYQIDENTTVLDSSKKIASKLITAFRAFMLEHKIVKDLTEFGEKYTTCGKKIDNCTVHYLRSAYVYLLSRSFGQDDESFNFSVWSSKMLGHAPGVCSRIVTYDGMAARGKPLKLYGIEEIDERLSDNRVPQPLCHK